MADEPKLLIDTFTFKPTLLEDKRSGGGKMIARGEFARANIPTENKRIYTKQLWERELTRLEKAIQERKVYSALDHPVSGRSELKNAAALIIGLRLEDGIIIGEAQIMGTREGNDLKAIIEAGGAVGVSSRGFGTTRPDDKGFDVVQDDYRLMTFDFVADPANTTSYPTITTEDKKQEKKEQLKENSMADIKTLDDLRKSEPALYKSLAEETEREFEKRGAEIWAKKIMAAKEEASTDLRAGFAEQLQQAVADATAEIEKKVRENLLNDPSVAGAKSALESLKNTLRPYVVSGDVEEVVKTKDESILALEKVIAEQKAEMAKIAEQNEKLAQIAKEAGYRYHVEKLVSGAPYADLVRKMIGDVKQYESVEQINAKVAEIAEDIKVADEKHVERDRELDRLKLENKKLQEANEKSLEAAKLLTLQNYVEQRLSNHPKKDQVRVVMESSHINSKEDVDSILSKFREKQIDPTSLDEARARVRNMLGGKTREYLSEEEVVAQKDRGNGASVNFNGVGLPLDELRVLSGMTEDKK
jgi:hypothetical protein